MIKFYPKDNNIIFAYTPTRGSGDDWVMEQLNQKGYITLKKTFTFQKEHIYTPPKEDNEQITFNAFDFGENFTSHFLFAQKIGEYYRVNRGVLIDQFDIYFHNDVSLEIEYFVADSDISIFNSIKPLLTGDFYIGGNHPGALPENGVIKMISSFPTSYEKKKYVQARISAVLREYFGSIKDAEISYHKYMNKKISQKGVDLKKEFKEAEIIKYETILKKLELMLDSEDGYSEKQWQEEILQILLLIYPKYLLVFSEVPIDDKNIEGRRLDYLLIDSSGYTDIVEIKRPFGNSILTENKYRNNFIPLRELSGTIMQIEKYIFYLNRWGPAGEKYLTEKYGNKLPNGFEIRITNPSGIIIMGRENNLSVEQKADFEVVKRKYKNVVDIITYDNLIIRLKSTIDQLKKL